MVLTQSIYDLGTAARKFASAQQLEWVAPCADQWDFNYYEFSYGDEIDLVRGERKKRVCILQRAAFLKEQSRVLSEYGNPEEHRFAAVLSMVCPALRYVYDYDAWSLDPCHQTTTNQLDVGNPDIYKQSPQELDKECTQGGDLIKNWADVKKDVLESTRMLISDLIDLRTIQERLTATRLAIYEHIRTTTNSNEDRSEKRQRGDVESPDVVTRFPIQPSAMLAILT